LKLRLPDAIALEADTADQEGATDKEPKPAQGNVPWIVEQIQKDGEEGEHASCKNDEDTKQYP